MTDDSLVTGTVIPFSRETALPREESPLDERTLALIGALRRLWRRTQLTRWEEFDHACFLIASDRNTGNERYSAAFFQGVQMFALRRLKFYTAKSQAVSEDEMWLARLLLALHSQDHTSARYLMALRIAAPGHRRLMFLAQGLAAGLCTELSPPTGRDRETTPGLSSQ
ncbi:MULTISPECIES: hypothetical protein [Rhodomicrobium]|uniref:hypothetical protein n=1 Tax=Rhodomicrobium TaxID=1068 RepID=UPI000B4A608D|nr:MULTISPECIES: hypothetical protein [Rhodomicrobium]